MVEDASFPEVMSEMYRLFGTRRMMELIGFCVLGGAVTTDEDGPFEVREKLMKMGFGRSTVYRFTDDMKKLVRSLEERRGETIPMSQVLREINSSDTSLMRDFVVK